MEVKQYRYYITDALQAIVYNGSGQDGTQYIKQSYRDLVSDKDDETEADRENAARKSQEIIDNIRNNKVFKQKDSDA